MGNCHSKRRPRSDVPETDPEWNGDTLRGNTLDEVKSVENKFPSFVRNDPPGFNVNNGVHQNTTQSQRSKNIGLTKNEVQILIQQIYEFQGASEDDKNYKYLDEMLTRCILKLDTIECNGVEDRAERKQTINQINQAISILERKMVVNSEIMELEYQLSES